jgi:hypothetical protein
MLNRIKVWGLSWPVHDLDSMVLEPGFSLFAGMFRVIILLEDDILAPFLEVLNRFLEFILQNAGIKVSIHPALNSSGIANSFLAYTAPHHQGSPSKLDSGLNQSVTKPLSLLLPGPLPPI